MACNCGSGNYVAPTPPVQVGCHYTVDMLNTLLGLANPQEQTYIRSQLNSYTFDCNYWQVIVIPIFQKYNIVTN